ncbi:MAG: LysM peptidoglycan-binding domain-containing protein [Terrimicrobiaceae bacterium]
MKTKKAIRMPLRRPPQRGRTATAPLRARAATAEEVYEEEDYEESEEPNMKFSHALIVVLALHLVAVGGVFAFNWMKAKQTAESKAPKAAALASSAPVEKTAPESAPAAPKPATIEGWQGKVHTVAAGDTLTRIAAQYGTTIEALEKENGITTYSMIRVGQGLKIPGSEKSPATAKTETAPAKPAASSSSAAMKQAFIATKTETAAVKPTATVVKPAAATIAAVPKTQTTEPAAKPTPAPVPATGDTYVVASGDNPYTIAKKLHVSYNELITLNGITDPTKIQIGQKLKVPKQK